LREHVAAAEKRAVEVAAAAAAAAVGAARGDSAMIERISVAEKRAVDAEVSAVGLDCHNPLSLYSGLAPLGPPRYDQQSIQMCLRGCHVSTEWRQQPREAMPL